MDEQILAELKLQTALLQEMGTNIAALRAEMKAVNKDAMEKAMKDAMGQVSEMFQNTPLGPVLSNMMARKEREKAAGGKPDGK